MQNDSFRAALADSLVPPHLHEGLVRWVEFGIPPGSFLRSVIANDLLGAVSRADDHSLAALPAIVSFLGNQGSLQSAFFDRKALVNWPLFIQAENRAEATEQARLALEETINEMETGR